MKKNFILPLMLGLLSVLPLYPASYTLDDLVTAMKSSSSELLSIDEEIYRSHLDTAEAEGAFSPTIDLALSGTYMVNPVIGPVTIDPSAISGLPPEFSMLFSNIDPFSVSLEMDPGMVQGQLTLTQPIFTWGKLSNAVKLRKKSESIVRTGRINRENQLVSELEARLDAIYYLEDIFSHLDEIEEKADALVKISERAGEAGAIVDDDVLEAELRKREVAVTRRELEGEFTSLIEAVRTLTGIDDLSAEDIIHQPDDEIVSSILSHTKDELIAAATSPSVLSLQMAGGMEEVQEYAEKIAKGSIYGLPDLALQVSASYGGSIGDDWSFNDSWGVNLTLALKTTLWDGGGKMNDVKRAASSLRESRIDYDSACREIEESVSSAYDAAMLSRERLSYLDMQHELEESRLSKEKEGLVIGSSSESDVLEREISLLECEIERAGERIKLSENVHTLSYLAGGAGRLPVITDGTK